MALANFINRLFRFFAPQGTGFLACSAGSEYPPNPHAVSMLPDVAPLSGTHWGKRALRPLGAKR